MAVEEGAEPGVPDQPLQRVVAGQAVTAERVEVTRLPVREPRVRTGEAVEGVQTR